jgi:hypothetical protein
LHNECLGHLPILRVGRDLRFAPAQGAAEDLKTPNAQRPTSNAESIRNPQSEIETADDRD